MNSIINTYNGRIQLYKDCIEFLHLYNYPNEEILKNTYTFVSPIRTIIETLLELDAIRDDGINYVSTENTLKYKNNRYFDNKIDELVAARNRDVLSERTAKSAEESAQAANRSADSAEKANKIATIANENSTLSTKIAILGLIISLIGLIKSFCS